MGRVRVAGIVKMPDGYGFMHRKNVKNRKYEEYYVFPGGGLEENETLEECIIREIEEEFGIKVKVIKKVYKIKVEEIDQTEYFYYVEYVSGKFGTGVGPEFNNDPKYIDSGEFIPEIIKKENVKDLFLIPSSIKEQFISDLENGRFD